MPKRIQRRRTKGWRKPEGAVIVTRPSRWGNPYTTAGGLSAAEAVGLFKGHALRRLEREADWLEPLKGKDLVCWCKEGAPCHADILLELCAKLESKSAEEAMWEKVELAWEEV